MYVGVCVNHSWDRDIEKQFSDIVENGFHHCQLVSWIPQKWTGLNELRESYLSFFDTNVCASAGNCQFAVVDSQQFNSVVPVERKATGIRRL